MITHIGKKQKLKRKVAQCIGRKVKKICWMTGKIRSKKSTMT